VKILQISSASSFGGGERYLADLTNSLHDRGHQVFAVLRPQSPLIARLNLPADQIRTIPLRNALDAFSARELRRFVKSNEIDIVHAHMARDYSLAAYAVGRTTQARLVVTRHVLFKLNRLHRRVLVRARVIAVSGAVARSLKEQRLVSDDQIFLVPNGIDVVRFDRALSSFDRGQFLQTNGFAPESLLVGSIGELRTLKRHDDFIRAAAEVAKQFPLVQFILAGIDTTQTGEVRKQLEQLVVELKLSDRFHFLGWMDNAGEVLCALDVFVSASETESFGLAIAEAMAARTAVVATATAGAQEVLEDQHTGLIVPIGDVGRLAESIAALLKDHERRHQIAAAAADAVREKFSLSRMVDQIEEVYTLPGT
jgi:glycosyltransferase involved in cell wall biosynthesis